MQRTGIADIISLFTQANNDRHYRRANPTVRAPTIRERHLCARIFTFALVPIFSRCFPDRRSRHRSFDETEEGDNAFSEHNSGTWRRSDRNAWRMFDRYRDRAQRCVYATRFLSCTNRAFARRFATCRNIIITVIVRQVNM